jgi:hypothetical protein
LSLDSPTGCQPPPPEDFRTVSTPGSSEYREAVADL